MLSSATTERFGSEGVGGGQPGGRVVPVKDEGIDAFGDLSHGNHRYLGQRIGINGGYRSGSRVGNIDNFAVGRKGDPLRHRTGWGMTKRMYFGQGSIADQFQRRKGVLEDRIGHGAIDPE